MNDTITAPRGRGRGGGGGGGGDSEGILSSDTDLKITQDLKK